MLDGLRYLGLIGWGLLLASLPVSLLNLTLGLFHGYFDHSLAVRLRENPSVPCDPTAREAAMLGLLSDFSEINNPPYDVPKLVSQFGWWKRLDLHSIDEAGRIGYGRALHPDSWYRKIEVQDSEAVWHHWIYLAGTSPSTAVWDEAFAELFDYHSFEPAANGAGFHHVSCRDTSLCSWWLIPGPALIHLTTEALDNEKHHIKIGSDTYSKVTLRFVELDQMIDRHHPKQTPFSRLRSLTHNDDAWKHECHRRSEEERLQLLQRMNYRLMAKKHPKTYGRLKPLGRAVMGKLWPPELFQHRWITITTFKYSRALVMGALDTWDILSALGQPSEDQSASDPATQEGNQANEGPALEEAAILLQCVDREVEFFQSKLTPRSWEIVDKIRETLPEEYKRAMKRGEITCGIERL